MIVISSICLALDVPRLAPSSELHNLLEHLNLVFALIFVGEALLKIVAQGFASTPNAYLKDGWNVLDFSIVIISLLGLLADTVRSPRVTALRVAAFFSRCA